MPAPRPPQLDYAPPPPLVRRARFRRWLALAGVGLALLSTLWWAPPLWRNARAVYWQRQCTGYAAPADRVVYEDDLPAGGVLTDGRGPAWDALYPFIDYANASRPMTRAVLFLHGRQIRESRTQLVVIELESPDPEFGEIQLRVWTPYSTHAFDPLGARYGIHTVSLPGLEGAKHLRFYADQPDPRDASRFTIRYEAGGRKGTIDGTLEEGGGIGLRPRQTSTTQP